MKYLLIISATLAAFLLILLSPIVPGYLFTDIQIIDNDFEGLFPIDLQDSFEQDFNDVSAEKNIAVLTVHGIGRHCIGYADELISGITKHMGLSIADPEQDNFPLTGCVGESKYYDLDYRLDTLCEAIHGEKNSDRDCHRLSLRLDISDFPTRVNKNLFVTGYLRIQDYRFPTDVHLGSVKLRLYELTWDTATRWAKDTYVGFPDSESDKSRALFNRDLKRQIINESIADAVLYLGDYRPFIQFPLLMSFCKIVSDIALDSPSNDAYDFSCDFKKIEAGLENSNGTKSEIVILTHSLGTRMVFDALGLIAEDDFAETFVKQLRSKGALYGKEFTASDFSATGVIRDVFQQRTNKIFTLANQVPLLELGVVDTYTEFFSPGTDDIGVGFAHFLEGRDKGSNTQSPLQLVAFTDPNDLLSYNLKCWYYLRVLKYYDQVKEQQKKDNYFYQKYFSSCNLPTEPDHRHAVQMKRAELWNYTKNSISLTDVTVDFSNLEYPYVFDDPGAAHSAFFTDKTIHRLIACGGKKGKIEPDKCAVQSQ